MEDQIEDMIRDVGQEFFQQAQSHVYDTLKSDSETPLFPDCTTYTRLSAVLRLMNLKEKYGWSDKSFTEFLEVLKLMLPKDNTLPDRHYEAKKVLCPMGLQYKKIHACPNDCILYRKEFESLQKCPRCGLSRYKVKDDDKRNCDGMLRHPTNSPQWKKIDGLFPNFGSEARNLRLGLASDGMNPFGNLSTNHSSWPVLFSIYNFPPCGYDINNFSFYTKSQDDNSTMQNSGVTLQAQSIHFSSRNDKNPIVASTSYYGVIEDIWEISYGTFKVLVFKCKWVDINIGVRTDGMGFTMVDLSKVGHKDEPFIMANQATQVFYVKDPIVERWFVVLQGRSVHNVDESTIELGESLSFSTRMPTNNEEIEQDDVHATRNDHDEGIWENIII
uniref:DUF4216 domain-containing protein n=1 Tax=Cajanus cajan TaxID=3821 RepID=A0A151R918_CAJCA|nr:hypothetical protein KK1_039716 [Cajanus cajan]